MVQGGINGSREQLSGELLDPVYADSDFYDRLELFGLPRLCETEAVRTILLDWLASPAAGLYFTFRMQRPRAFDRK